MNVGPKADGTFTHEETEVLRELGEWIKLNGEGIYESLPYKFYKEGENQVCSGMFSESEVEYNEKDFRSTYKPGTIYAFQMKPSKTAKINSLHTDRCGICIKNVSSLTNDEIKSFTCDSNGLFIELNSKPEANLPICYKIELE